MCLSNNDFKEKLIKKLSSFIPEVIDFAKLDTSLAGVLKLLVSIDDDFKSKFVDRFDNLFFISEEGIPLLSYLLDNDFEEELVELLPDSLDDFEKSDQLFFLLRILLNGFNIKVEDSLLDILRNSKNIFREKGSSDFLSELVNKGLGLDLLEMNILPDLISDEDCTLQFDFLLKLIDRNFVEDIKDRLGFLSLKDISSEKAVILFHIVKKGFGQEILDRLSGDFELNDVFYSYSLRYQDRYQIRFLELLASSGFKSQLLELFSEKLEGYGELVRDSISFDELEVNAKVGPHLDEIIEKFPILPGSIKELRGGWVRGKIRKKKKKDEYGNVIEEGEVFIYLKIENESFKVVFRNKNIEEQHLDTYKEAFDLIPEFVSNPVYSELQNKQEKNNSSPKVFSSEPRMLSAETSLPTFGFREVYAGVSLSTLSMKSLPDKVKESIENQKKYILMKLAINGIHHGHSHNANFNVRFLLEKDGEKQLFFDINVALQHAIKNEMNFTPIVTLRDWDQATS